MREAFVQSSKVQVTTLTYECNTAGLDKIRPADPMRSAMAFCPARGAATRTQIVHISSLC